MQLPYSTIEVAPKSDTNAKFSKIYIIQPLKIDPNKCTFPQLLVGYGMVESITLNNTYIFNAVQSFLIQADEELLCCLPLINPTIKYRQKKHNQGL